MKKYETYTMVNPIIFMPKRHTDVQSIIESGVTDNWDLSQPAPAYC